MELIKYIQQFSNPFLDVFFQLVTMMGEDVFFIFVTAVIYWCVDKDLGYKIGFITLTSASINLGIKEFLKVPRPIGQPGIRSLRIHTAGGYSFPSGHTQNTTTLWTFFMSNFRRGWVYTVGILSIMLVGLSRLYLGVHTPADVVGGIIIGAVWVLLCGALYDNASQDKRKILVIAATAASIAGLYVFREANYYKVTGALTGFLAGYLIEPRYIGFDVRASLVIQVFKLAFGLLMLFLLRLILKLVFPELLIFYFLRYMILILWVTIAAPYIFKRFIYTMK